MDVNNSEKPMWPGDFRKAIQALTKPEIIYVRTIDVPNRTFGWNKDHNRLSYITDGRFNISLQYMIEYQGSKKVLEKLDDETLIIVMEMDEHDSYGTNGIYMCRIERNLTKSGLRYV